MQPLPRQLRRLMPLTLLLASLLEPSSALAFERVTPTTRQASELSRTTAPGLQRGYLQTSVRGQNLAGRHHTGAERDATAAPNRVFRLALTVNGSGYTVEANLNSYALSSPTGVTDPSGLNALVLPRPLSIPELALPRAWPGPQPFVAPPLLTERLPAQNKSGGIDWTAPAASPDDLGDEWEDATPPEQREKSPNRRFKNKNSGAEIECHSGKKGRDGKPVKGTQGKDHWHRYNPESKQGNRDLYLDRNGNPVSRNSKPSHIVPRSEMNVLERAVDGFKSLFESTPDGSKPGYVLRDPVA